MKYDFSKLIERRGTGCVKWDENPADDMIPLWVADMDFPVAPAIQEAIRKRAEHGVFGYTLVGNHYYDAVISWFQRRHQWAIQPEEILYTTGVVPAMSVAIKALTMPGEQVLILSPDYNCFFSSIRNNGCQVVESALKDERLEMRNERYDYLQPDNKDEISNQNKDEISNHISHFSSLTSHFKIDWQDFEAKCAEEKTTLFLLCNPHNPTGRVWTAEELERMNTICMRHGVKVVSDEIHCELIMPGQRFQPFAAVSEACRENSVILNSPSKSFNIAGLQIANIICSQPEWRRRINRAININEVCDVNPFAPVALIAAYNESEDWIDALNAYLWENYLALCDFAAKNIPQWHVCPLQGTYLVWVDITATDQTSQAYADRLMHEANVWVNPGTMYGPQSGEGYIRINIACPRSLLLEALKRIAAVS